MKINCQHCCCSLNACVLTNFICWKPNVQGKVASEEGKSRNWADEKCWSSKELCKKGDWKDKTRSMALLDHIKLEAMEINIKINICITPAANQAILLDTSDSLSYYFCPSVLSWKKLRLAAQTIQGTFCGLNACSVRHYHA